MKFKAVPVTSLEDATIDFEQLQTTGIFKDTTLGGALSGTLPNPSLATGTVLQLATTGTTRKIAFGSATATFTASANSATVTVTHGLGVTPLRVQLTASGISGVRTDIFAAIVPGSLTTTQFQFIAFVGNQAVTSTGSSTVYWDAIG